MPMHFGANQKPDWKFFCLLIGGAVLALLGFLYIPDQNITTIIYIIAAAIIGSDSGDADGQNKSYGILLAIIMAIVAILFNIILFPKDWSKLLPLLVLVAEIAGVEIPKP